MQHTLSVSVVCITKFFYHTDMSTRANLSGQRHIGTHAWHGPHGHMCCLFFSKRILLPSALCPFCATSVSDRSRCSRHFLTLHRTLTWMSVLLFYFYHYHCCFLSTPTVYFLYLKIEPTLLTARSHFTMILVAPTLRHSLFYVVFFLSSWRPSPLIKFCHFFYTVFCSTHRPSVLC